MFDVTEFYSPVAAPEGCRIKVDEREAAVTVGQGSFTVRGPRLIVDLRPVEVADVLEVRVGRGEPSALRGATRALELVIRDKAGQSEVLRPIVREAPEAVAWGVARLREVLGHVPVERPAPFDEAGLAPLAVGGGGGGVNGGVLACERHGVAVVQFGRGKLYLRLRADAEELRADVVAWAFARSFRWAAGEIFAVGSERGWNRGYGEPGADYGLNLHLVDGRRVWLGAWTREGGAAAAAEMLGRALCVPSRAEWSRRFLDGAGGVAAPVVLRRGAGKRASGVAAPPASSAPLVLSYANSPEREIRATLGGGMLTVRTLPLPPVRAWARAMIVNWPVLACVLFVGGGLALALVLAFAPKPSAVDGLWVLITIAIWSGLCAIAGVGHRALVTVDGEGLSLKREALHGRIDEFWRLDEIERVEPRWNRVVLRTRVGSRTLVWGDDARELRELAGVLNAAVGAGPPPAAVVD